MNDPAPPTIDFTACEAERLDAPGAIQDHGWILALDAESGTVTHQSSRRGDPAEAADFLGMDPMALDAALDAGGKLAAAISTRLADAPATVAYPARAAGRHGGDLLVSRSATHVLVECRFSTASAGADTTAWLDAFAEMLTALPDNVPRHCAETAERVKQLTGFSRVMVYRFAPDWHGEVVAEAREDRQEPFLGLHYPATDIPSQARTLYLTNTVREIGDVRALSSIILPACTAESAVPVDLTPAVLRAISPYHLEYLANMGVAATLVASIVVEGRLWGLIACHAESPAVVSWPVRVAMEKAAGLLSEAIATAQTRQRARRAERSRSILAKTEESLRREDAALKAVLDVVMASVSADGAALVTEGEALAFGFTPDVEAVAALAKRLPLTPDTPVRVRERAAELTEPDADIPGYAGGAAAVRLPGEPPAYLLLFRREHRYEVEWGGDPNRAAEFDAKTGRLSPRRSFAVWRQTVRGRCRAWEPELSDFLEAFARSPLLAAAMESLPAQLPALRDEIAHEDALHTAVLNAALDGMTLAAVTDADSHVHLASTNAAFRQIFDLSTEECENTDFTELLHLIGVEIDTDELARADMIEVLAWSRARGPRHVQIFRRKVLEALTDQDTTRWVMYIFHDITDLRREQEALRAAKDRAERESTAKMEFLANMSHELRTPMNAIIVYSEILSAEMFGRHANSNYLDYSKHIHEAGKQLLGLIDDLLDISRLEAGQWEVRMEPVDLAAACREALSWAEHAYAGPKAAIRSELPHGPLFVAADRRAILQILTNLLSNAVKFSGPDGTVVLSGRLSPDGGAEIAVSDDGPGIPTDRLSEVMLPFRQLETVFSRSHGGAGLGLSIAKALADRMDATLRLESTEGVGTRVIVRFPAERVNRAQCGPATGDD
jgi:light-regulated signal transduction histidine kinase (bacteriophytochrome)